METGCPYPLNEDDPPVTRLVAMLLLATQAHAQVYHLHLSDNTCRITECVDTPQGVKPLGQTWKGNTFHDRFTLDFDRAIFTWEKEGKETYANKIINTLPNTLTTHSPRSRLPPTSPSTAIGPSFNLSTFRMANGYKSLILRDRELTAHANIYNIYHLYLIFVLFICE